MTDPVDTDALRDMGATLTKDGHPFGPRITAAADEVDRLRDRAADDARDREQLRVDFNARAAEASRLRAVIENAPHGKWCDANYESTSDKCTCWKSGEL